MSGSVSLRRGRRRPGAALMVPLLSVTILVLGWSVLWGAARRQAVAGLDGLLAAEAAHGRVWSCPDRAVTGYPFRIALTCGRVGFAGAVDGTPAEGHLAGLSAEAWIYEPSSVTLTLTGPMNLGNPREIPVRELAERVLRLTGSKSSIVFRPLPQDDPMQRCPDITQARAVLGWEPTVALDQGLERTIAYCDHLLAGSDRRVEQAAK